MRRRRPAGVLPGRAAHRVPLEPRGRRHLRHGAHRRGGAEGDPQRVQSGLVAGRRPAGLRQRARRADAAQLGRGERALGRPGGRRRVAHGWAPATACSPTGRPTANGSPIKLASAPSAQMDIMTIPADRGEPVPVVERRRHRLEPDLVAGRSVHLLRQRPGRQHEPVARRRRRGVGQVAGRARAVDDPGRLRRPSEPLRGRQSARVQLGPHAPEHPDGGVRSGHLDPVPSPRWLTTGSRQWSSPDLSPDGALGGVLLARPARRGPLRRARGRDRAAPGHRRSRPSIGCPAGRRTVSASRTSPTAAGPSRLWTFAPTAARTACSPNGGARPRGLVAGRLSAWRDTASGPNGAAQPVGPHAPTSRSKRLDLPAPDAALQPFTPTPGRQTASVWRA